MDPFKVGISWQICSFEWGKGNMHSLNYPVYQHLFKVTISHYKHLFWRHEALRPGGVWWHWRQERCWGLLRGTQGWERKGQESVFLTSTAWHKRRVYGESIETHAPDVLRIGACEERPAPVVRGLSPLFGSLSPWPYIWCLINGSVNKFWACYF